MRTAIARAAPVRRAASCQRALAKPLACHASTPSLAFTAASSMRGQTLRSAAAPRTFFSMGKKEKTIAMASAEITQKVRRGAAALDRLQGGMPLAEPSGRSAPCRRHEVLS